MARRLIIGGASVGLSALLAALLLSAPPPQYSRAAEAVKKMQDKAPQSQSHSQSMPRAIMLPPPPRQAPAAPLHTLQPSVKTKPRTKFKAMAVTIQTQQPRPARVVETPTVVPSQQLAPVATKAPDDPEPRAVAAQGRVLLRLLEHGQGPAIELAWPQDAGERAQLYRHFRDCLGMRVALIRRAGELFVADSPPGESWRPNADRYSGFARQPSGRLAAAEREDLRAIARRHDLSPRSSAMRIFPRQVDAQLLGGLEQIMAGSYGQAKEIRARYYLRGDAILVGDIQADGRPVAGSISLNSPCRRG
ncbi:MAG: hypothetical protein O2967_16405 [Proteobacteria bacterium]|nr:hypothetical protein [Pseudomonadota bacterium]